MTARPPLDPDPLTVVEPDAPPARPLSLRARLVLAIALVYAAATATGYLLPLVIRPTVEAVSSAFVLGLVAAWAGDWLLGRLDG